MIAPHHELDLPDLGAETDAALSLLDGMMTAVAIGPVAVPVREIFAALRSDGEVDATAEPGWEAATEAALAEMRLRIETGMYRPIFCDEAEGKPDIAPWCAGFMMGVRLRSQDWKPLALSRDGIYLVPILAFAGAFEAEGFDAGAALDDFDALSAIPELVARIAEYWSRRASYSPRSGAKVGRNALCPCGSGAKFKRCCGDAAKDAATALHA